MAALAGEASSAIKELAAADSRVEGQQRLSEGTQRESEQYTIPDIEVVGELPVPREQLRQLVLVEPGSMFNLRLLTQSVELMKFRLGEEGYANAEIELVTELDHANQTVDITFFIDPGNRVYVRRINFRGTDEVDDAVLRRELRQQEGAYLSNRLVDRSIIRLQRLPFVENVEVEIVPVPGSPDLVDLNFIIDYRMAGHWRGGIGYSQSQKLTLQGSFVEPNFLGTGDRLALTASTGQYSENYRLSYTDPYVTANGVRRTIDVGHRDITQLAAGLSDFFITSTGASIEYAYPVTELQDLSFGIAYRHAELLASSASPVQAQDWVMHNGNPFALDVGGGPTRFGSRFDTVELLMAWSYDSRNRAIFADRGARHRLDFSVTAPGSEVEYFTARYNFTHYLPMYGAWTLRVNTDLGYGEALGDTTALPPYERFFAGGPDSVRGYRESFLGPRDSLGNPYGGNALIAAQLELIVPVPEEFRERARASLFYDVGNVFTTGEVRFTDKLGNPVTYDPEFDELRASVGVAVQWLAPIGFLQFSYAYPLNDFPGSDRLYGDDTERFQFTIGNAF
ncbi:MAG TPA: outer membrane protein assembly factor BamA [Woeseiaceae bacterium]|nr:outer membrane protein assembly factor BamA [Woeseiaceae bacterium]